MPGMAAAVGHAHFRGIFLVDLRLSQKPPYHRD